MENLFFDIHYLPREWRVVADALKKDCPHNDCISYLYYVEKYDAMIRDYDTFADQMSEYSRAALERAISAERRGIADLYMNNHAVKKYRESVKGGAA